MLLHAIKELKDKPDYIVLLQPTSPLRNSKDIDESIKKIIKEKSDSLLSAFENEYFFWSKDGKPLNYSISKRPRRQDRIKEYVENGAIYITKYKTLLKNKNRLGGKISLYVMDKYRSIEIDEPKDFDLAENIYQKKQYKLPKYRIKNNIKLAIFDIDGIFTDGSVYYSEKKEKLLRFSRIDGKGVELLHKKGIKVAIITSEKSKIVGKRAKKLKIKCCFTGVKKKIKVYNLLKAKYGLKDNEVIFCGDDVNDLEVIEKAGCSACPAGAQEIVKRKSKYVSKFYGGNGFVRDISNIILAGK